MLNETHEGNRNERPLLTFVLFAYNQEGFIRDAVGGALNQTYSPLEIILSDDCSTDRTFGVMQEMASNYRGPHHIVLNCNPKNLGPGEHLNRIVELSNGALIVYAEGDDISLPERTSVIYEAWESSGRAVTSIYSDYSVIDKSGASWNPGNQRKKKTGDPLFRVQRGDLRNFLTTWRPMIYGCTHAWSQCLFRQFGGLPVYLKYGDIVLSFRSLGINGILYIDRPLVKYRRHDNNFSFHGADDTLDRKSSSAYDAKCRDALKGLAMSYEAMIHDIAAMRRMDCYESEYLASVEREGRRIQSLYLLKRQMISEPFLQRLRAIFQILSRGGPRVALTWAPQLLPRRLYHMSRGIKRTAMGYLHKADVSIIGGY